MAKRIDFYFPKIQSVYLLSDLTLKTAKRGRFIIILYASRLRLLQTDNLYPLSNLALNLLNKVDLKINSRIVYMRIFIFSKICCPELNTKTASRYNKLRVHT